MPTSVYVLLAALDGQCTNRLDVVIMLDSSKGITGANFIRSLSFVDAVTRELGVSRDFVRFGLMTFATKPRLAFNLIDYLANEEGLSNAILTQRYKPGKTNTAGAIRNARSVMFRRRNGDRPDVKVYSRRAYVCCVWCVTCG